MSMFNTFGVAADHTGRKENTLRKLDRLHKALRHEEPDRVPISDFFWGGFTRRWRQELGLSDDANPYYHYELDWIVTVPNMAILTGCLWYGQFFFYGFGHFYIMKVAGFEQTCWAIHMILLILLGTLIGVVFKEWKGCRPRTYATLVLALALLICGKLLLDYGNYLGVSAHH